MTRTSHILLGLLTMALVAFVGVGCVEPLRPDEKYGQEGIQIPIEIHLPARGGVATKAISDGPVAGLAQESALHSLQVWAYTHPMKSENVMTDAERNTFLTEGPIAYLNVPDLNVLERVDEDASVEVSMIIPSYILKREDEALKLDFYVLGNGASIGLGNAGSLSREQIRSAVFQGSVFGTDQERSNFMRNFVQSSFPLNGLPMACFFDNRGSGYDISFLKTDPNPTPARMEEIGRVWPEMELSRSVARMRFLFAQATNMNAHIDSIKLYDFDNTDNPGLIPSESFVFPRENPSEDITLPDGVNYETILWGYPYTVLLPSIGQMDDPTELCSNSPVMRGMSAQYFDSYVQPLIASGKVTSSVIYLRESNKPIKGTIYYNGDRDSGTPSKTADFTMTGLGFPDLTNFYRNHSWTVYAYMIGQHMEVDVRLDDWVLPWIRSEVTIDGDQTINVDQDGKFITDADMQADSLRYDSGTVIPKSDTNRKPKKKWFNVPVPAGDKGVTGRVVIYAPLNGKLIVTPVAVDTAEFWPKLTPDEKADFVADTSVDTYVTKWFNIRLTNPVIDRSVDPDSHVPGLIGITITRKNPAPLNGCRKAIKLSFAIEVKENEGTPNEYTRTIAADSELIDDEYHFIINP